MAEVLTRAEASALATAAFEGTGVAPGPAAAAAEVLVIAEMMGIATHGLKRVPAYGRRLDAGGIDATARIEVAAPLPAIRMIDGRGGLGPAVAARALDEAVAAARSSGIAIALCRRSNHLGPLAPYLWRAAERGFATIAMSTAMAMMAPTGGREARLGNNPLGIGVPDPGGRHVLLDMALSVAARSHIREAAAAGRPIPPGWATDAAGRPTEDAAAALAGLVLPAGGYKGYGLAAAVDLFAGVLAGAASLTA
ncbi:MAG: Ldh family oxidoreductase, partial [Pseudomonadota bacterium]